MDGFTLYEECSQQRKVPDYVLVFPDDAFRRQHQDLGKQVSGKLIRNPRKLQQEREDTEQERRDKEVEQRIRKYQDFIHRYARWYHLTFP